MNYSGHVRQGLVVFDQPVVLPEGLAVCIEVADSAVPVSFKEPQDTPGRRLLKYAGKAVGLPPDAAKNHDHYIHGSAKR